MAKHEVPQVLPDTLAPSSEGDDAFFDLKIDNERLNRPIRATLFNPHHGVNEKPIVVQRDMTIDGLAMLLNAGLQFAQVKEPVEKIAQEDDIFILSKPAKTPTPIKPRRTRSAA